MLYRMKLLKKRYGERTVLDLMELELQGGKVIGLLGPNGAGKTTLLEILAFLLPPSSGEIFFEGRRVDYGMGHLSTLRKRVVLVQQQSILFTDTVQRNVEFPMRIRGVRKRQRDRAAAELLGLVGMEPMAQAKAHRLSGGETQRVAIARALACSPEVILLDEPTSNVDVENQFIIEDIIRRINRERGLSVVITTHDMAQASRLADETVFLFEGKVASSAFENIFNARIETDPEGDCRCTLHGGLKLTVRSGKAGPARVSIDPGAVRIGPSPPKPGAPNPLKGRLTQLIDEPERVRALVDAGIPLCVLIPKTRFQTMGLTLGEDVWLTVPEEAIQII